MFARVVEQHACDEVHPLHVSHLQVVLRDCAEEIFELDEAGLAVFAGGEAFLARECAVQVAVDLFYARDVELALLAEELLPMQLQICLLRLSVIKPDPKTLVNEEDPELGGVAVGLSLGLVALAPRTTDLASARYSSLCASTKTCVLKLSSSMSSEATLLARRGSRLVSSLPLPATDLANTGYGSRTLLSSRLADLPSILMMQ